MGQLLEVLLRVLQKRRSLCALDMGSDVQAATIPWKWEACRAGGWVGASVRAKRAGASAQPSLGPSVDRSLACRGGRLSATRHILFARFHWILNWDFYQKPRFYFQQATCISWYVVKCGDSRELSLERHLVWCDCSQPCPEEAGPVWWRVATRIHSSVIFRTPFPMLPCFSLSL